MMRGGYRTTFAAGTAAILILWYFINFRRGLLSRQVSLEKTRENHVAQHPILHEASPVAQPIAFSSTQLPANAISSTQEVQATVTKSPATGNDIENVDQKTPDELSPSRQDETTHQSVMKKGELVMIVASSGTGGYLGVPGTREMVYENRMSYAERWDHEFMWANMSSYNFSKTAWNKIPIIQEAHVRYPKAKWFWWLDFDAIIVNGSLDIHDHILSSEGIAQNLLFDADIPQVGGGFSGFRTPTTMDADNVNMLIAFDHWGMNTGSFLMRRSEWTDMVLKIWADPLFVEKEWIFYDQDAWVHIYQHNEFIRRHTGIVKQRAFNGYARTNPLGAHWQPGDLVVHFPGCGSTKNMTNCRNNWMSYWENRDDHPTPDWILKQLGDGAASIESAQRGKL